MEWTAVSCRRLVDPPDGSTSLHACCTRGFRKCRCVAPSRHFHDYRSIAPPQSLNLRTPLMLVNAGAYVYTMTIHDW